MDRDELEEACQDVSRIKNRLENALSNFKVENVKSVAEEQMLVGYMNSLTDKRDRVKRVFEKTTSSFLKVNKSSPMLIRRVEKLISDSNLLIFAAERELKIFTSQIQQRKDRERLFGGDGDNPASRRRGGMAEEALLQEEKSRLDTASAMISTAIEQGAMSLQNLSHQKQFLKGTRKKLELALISVGISASTLTSIEARLRSDRLLAYGGIILVVVVIYLFFCWWTGIHVFWWFPSRWIGRLWRLMLALGSMLRSLVRLLLLRNGAIRNEGEVASHESDAK